MISLFTEYSLLSIAGLVVGKDFGYREPSNVKIPNLSEPKPHKRMPQ